MKKIILFALFCISFISIVFHSVSYAESRAGAATLTLGAGHQFFASKRDINNADIPYIALGYDFTQHWGIEGLLGLFHTTFKSTDDKRGMNGTLFAVDGLYHFSPYKIIEPYVLAGVGVTGLSLNRFDGHNEGNVNAGAGVQLFFDQSVALRLEARDFYTLVGGKNDVLLDAGVSFLLDLC